MCSRTIQRYGAWLLALLAVATVSPAAALAPPASGSPPSAVAGGADGPGATGQVFLTVDEALELAFPDCQIERRRVFLTEEQHARAKKLADVEIDSAIVRPYVATKDGKLVGTAYFDAHRVRTLKETVMFVAAPDNRIARVEVLAFAEPIEYMPRGTWYAQFLGRVLDEELNLKRGIKNVTGATLTARATTEAARRVLALHQVVNEAKGAARAR